MGFLRKLNVEIILALIIGFFAVSINSVYYQNATSLRQALDLMVKYFSFGNPFLVWFFLFIYLVFLEQFYLVCTRLTQAYVFEKKIPTRQDVKELLRCIVKPLYLLAPLVIVTGPMFALLANISYQLRLSTVDGYFLQADRLLFGRYLFLSLPTLLSAPFATAMFENAYMSLALVLSAAVGSLYLFDQQVLFRRAIVAFLISLAISYPFFYLFPCQDPSHYVIQNLRNYPVSSETREALKIYKPSLFTAQVVKQIDDAETEAARDNTVPISCFPSMHAVWAFLVVYFLARVKAWTLWISIPWTLLVLSGGLYVAQHYAVDYLMAFPIAALSILGSSFLLILERRWKSTLRT